MTWGGEGVGAKLKLVDAGVSGVPVLLVNPLVHVSTAKVFAAWDGKDRGPLGNWRDGRNDLEHPAKTLAPEIDEVLEWLGRQGNTTTVRMSGSGATCFAIFEDERARSVAAAQCPDKWWNLSTFLR